MADTGDCMEGVTVKVIAILDVPPDILTATSTDPEDSEPLNCSDVNSTIKSSMYKTAKNKSNCYHLKTLTSRVSDDSHCTASIACCYCWTK